ncbi:MAG: endolytic transglycosylase MltG, partial [Rikenellaceae bacterium]|nr:endolytic transglycosylase MltG [Rikenellaceae bacterium]
MTRKFWRRLALVVCMGFVTLVLLAGCVLISTRIGCVRTPGYIYVKHGTSYQTLLEELTADRKIRYKAGFDYYAKHICLDTCVRPGRYELSEGMSYVEVARMFKLGLQSPLNITFNNARDQYLLAQKLAPQIEPDSAAIVAGFDDAELLARLGVSSAKELFGMI